MASATDFAKIFIERPSRGNQTLEGEQSYSYWIKDARAVNANGKIKRRYLKEPCVGIRPVLKYLDISNFLTLKEGVNKVLEAQYGAYPQTAVDNELFNLIEKEFRSNNLLKSGKTYNLYSYWDSTKTKLYEFIYNDEKYVRVIMSNLHQI